jgi:protoheme IX farnesyltransferase
MSDGILLNDGEREASASLLTGAELGDWIALLKPRVVALVVFTGAVGLLIAPGGINPVLGFAAVLCIAVGAGAAGAINMWYDRDIDAVMRRTSRRPIPAGVVLPGEALGFGVTLAVGSVLVMYLATNGVAAAALAVSILFYVFVYTIWLKRRTPQNIVIGGAAGAFPPIVGWAAVTGHVGIYPLILFLVVFLWTPPHFWSLSLYACKDYERAGVPMLPVVAGARVTRWNILGYALALLPVSLLPWALGYAGWIYGGAAAVLGVGFIACAVEVLRDCQDEAGRSLTNDRPARRAFRFSLGYLAVLFAAALMDSWVL